MSNQIFRPKILTIFLAVFVVFLMTVGGFIGAVQDSTDDKESNFEPMFPSNEDAKISEPSEMLEIDTEDENIEAISEGNELFPEPIVPSSEIDNTDDEYLELIIEENDSSDVLDPDKPFSDDSLKQDNDLTSSTDQNMFSSSLEHVTDKIEKAEATQSDAPEITIDSTTGPRSPPAPLSTLEIVIGTDNDNYAGESNGYIYKPSSGTSYYSRDNDYMYTYQSTYERRGWAVFDLSDLTQYNGIKINSVQMWWRHDYRYRVSTLDFWSMKSIPHYMSTASTAQGWFNEIGGVGSRKLATFNFTGYSNSNNFDVSGTMNTAGVNWMNSKLINNDYDVAIGADISKLYSSYTSGYLYTYDLRLKINITYTSMPDERKGELAVGDDLCGYVRSTYKYDIGRIYTSGSSYRGYATWDPAKIKPVIPSTGPGGEKVILTGISVRIDSEYGYLNNFKVYPMSNDPKTASTSTIYSDAASGTPYAEPSYTYYGVAHEYEWDLGSSALDDFNKSLSGISKFFALGFSQSSYNYLYSPRLVIKWKIMLPPQKSIQLGADNPEKAGQAQGYSYKSGTFYQCYTQYYAQPRIYSTGAERRGWATFDLQDLNLWSGVKVKKAQLLIHNYGIYYANVFKFTAINTTPYNYPGSATSKKVFDESGSSGTIIGEYTNLATTDTMYKTIKIDLNSAAVTAINNTINSSSTYKTFGVGMYIDKLLTGYSNGYAQWHDIRLKVWFEFSDELKSADKGKSVAFGDDWSGQVYKYTPPAEDRPYGYWYIKKDNSTETRNYAQWDIKQISRAFDKVNLSLIIIKKVSLRFNHLRTKLSNIYVYQLTKNVTSASANDLFDDCADGTVYYGPGSTSSSYNEYTWNLGSEAVKDFQNAIEDGNPKFFGVGINTTSTSGYAYDFSPKLVIEFKYPGPSVLAKLAEEPVGYETIPTMFNASASRNLTGGIKGLRYEWDWDNDGIFDENSSSPYANRTWNDDWIGNITLRVNDTLSGQNASTEYTVVILNLDPKCNCTNSLVSPQPAYEAGEVTFSGFTVDDPGNDTWRYFWDFNADGIYDKWGNCTGNKIPTEKWYYEDDFLGEAILLIIDEDGGTTNLTTNHKVTCTPPSSGTGYVYNYGSKYTSSSIYYHYSYTEDYRRGWAKIDLSEIPKDGVISKMVFRGTVAYNYSNGVDMFGVHLLTSDPTSASGSIVYNEAGTYQRLFGLTGSVGDKKKDMTKWVRGSGKANVTEAVKNGWIGLGFDFESPESGYRYGYMRGYGYNLPALDIVYQIMRPGCFIPVNVINVAPILNCKNLTITPKTLNEGDIIHISNISFCDVGNDTYEAKIVIGDTFETKWIPLGGHVSGRGLVINEICTNGGDWVELYNYGKDIDLTGWKLYLDEYPSQGLFTFTFPTFTLNSQKFVVVHEYSGTNDEDDLYTGSNIPWNNMGPSSCVSLVDTSNKVIDYVPWNGYESSPNPTVPTHPWSGSIQQASSNDNIYRNSDEDTDSASDWSLAPSSSATPKALNPGQTGKGVGFGTNETKGWGVYGPGCHHVNETFNVTIPDDFPATGTSWDDVTVTVYIRDDDDHLLIPGTGIGNRENPSSVHSNAYYSYSGYNGRKVVVDSNFNIYAIYIDRQSSPYQVHIGRSSDNGESWEKFKVSDRPYFISSQYYPTLTIDSNDVLHAVWRGYGSEGTYHIRYANSKDGGETWGEHYNISSGYGYYPSVAVDKNDKIHIAWSGYQTSSPYKVFYINRSASGTWGKNTQVSDSIYSYQPDIIADSKGNVHIAWYGYLSSTVSVNNIHHRILWSNNGSWSNIYDVTSETSSTYPQYYPSIALDNSDNLHMAWQGRDSTANVYYNIFYSKFDANTKAWGSKEYATQITSGSPYHSVPSIAINKAGDIDIIHYGRQPPSWSTPYVLHHAEKVGGSWVNNWNIFNFGSNNQYYPVMLYSYPNSIPDKGFAFTWYPASYTLYYWTSENFKIGKPEFTDGLVWCNDTLRVSNVAPKIDLNATFVTPTIVKEQEPFIFHTEFEDPAAGVFTEVFEYNLSFSGGQYSGWQPVTRFKEGQPAGWTEITLKPNAADGKDAYIYNVSTSTAYRNYNYGSYIYSYLRGYMSGSTNYRARSLIEWDLTKIPRGYDLANATMRLYFGYKGTPSGTRTLYWYPITESWVEGTKSGSTASPGEVTWNNQPKYDGTSMASYTWAYGSGWIDFSLDIDVVEGWINNPSSNYGMLCKFGNEVGSYLYGYYRNSDYSTSTYHPELILEFEDPMPEILPRGIIEEPFMMPDDHPETGTPWDIVGFKVQIRDDDLGTDNISTNMTVYNVPPEIKEGTIYTLGDSPWTTGKFGSALKFDGVEDYVDCGNDDSLDITDSITIEAWIMPAVVGETGGTNQGSPISKAEAGTTWSWQIRYNAPGGGNYLGFQCNDKSVGSTWVTVDQALPPGKWYHIAAKFDSTTSKISMYLNGVLKDSASLSGIKSGTSKLFIGYDGWPDNFFNGKIDEVAIFDRALSTMEIQQHFNIGIGTGSLPPGLVGYWSFDEGSGNIAHDSSGYNNHGRIYGTEFTEMDKSILNREGIPEGTLLKLEGFEYDDVAFDVWSERDYGFNYSIDWGDGTPPTPWMNNYYDPAEGPGGGGGGGEEALYIGSHSRTYSGMTRGYWFTAPTDFIIRGLRVPLDASTGVQTVAVIRFNSPIPQYSSTTNDFTVLGYWRGLPGYNIIKTNFKIKEGDIMGIYGCRGTNTANSYSSGTISSSIGGYPISLVRTGMQHNMYSTAPANIWSLPSGSISRVEMYYSLGGGYIIKDNVDSSASAYNNGRKMVMDSNDNLYAIYQNGSTTSQIYIGVSANMGENWTEHKVSTDIASAGRDQFEPSLTIDSSDVLHAVWRGDVNGYNHIRYANSADGGISWSNFEMVTSGAISGIGHYTPSIAVDSADTIHLTWHGSDSTYLAEYNIFYVNRTSTSTWGTTTMVTSDLTDRYHQYPSLAVDSDDNVHVVWTGQSSTSTKYNLQYRMLSETTGTWDSIEMLTNSTINNHYMPNIAIDLDDNIHVVCHGYRSPSQIRYMKWDATTSTWGSMEDVTHTSVNKYNPSVGVDHRGYVYVVWYETGFDSINMSINTGSDWSESEPFTSPDEFSSTMHPNIMYGGKHSIPAKGMCLAFTAEMESKIHLFWASTSDFNLTDFGPWKIIPALTHLYRDDNPTSSPYDIYNITLRVRDDDTGIGEWVLPIKINNAWPMLELLELELELVGGENALYTPEINFVDPGTGPNESWSYWIDLDNSETWTAGDLNGNAITTTIIDDKTHGTIQPIKTPFNDDYKGTIGVYLYDDDVPLSSRNINITYPIMGDGEVYQIRNPSTTSATAYNNGRNLVCDSEGNLYMVYRDRTSPYHIFLKKSEDMGKTWIPSANQNGYQVSSSAQTYNLYPSIAIDSKDTLHVVWGADVSGNSYDSVFYSNSTNGGVTWTNPIVIYQGFRRTFSGGYDYRRGYVPSIAVDSNDVVHVVWEIYRYFYRSSPYTRFYNRGIQYISNKGGSWGTIADVHMYNGTSSYYHYSPSIAIDSKNNVHVAWYGDYLTTSYNKMLYKKMNGTTNVWDVSPTIINQVTGYHYRPSIATDINDNVHIVWYGYPSSYRIKYREYNAASSSWGSVIQVSTSSGTQYYPTVGTDQRGYVYVTWYGYPSPYTIYLRVDKGSGFGTQEEITSDSSIYYSSQYYPSIIGYGPNCYPKSGAALVWSGYYRDPVTSATSTPTMFYSTDDFSLGRIYEHTGYKTKFDIFVENSMPQIEAPTTLYFMPNEELSFDLELTDPGSDDLYLQVDWGDGSTNYTKKWYNNGTNPEHIYPPTHSALWGKAPFTQELNLRHTYKESRPYFMNVTLYDDDQMAHEENGSYLMIKLEPMRPKLLKERAVQLLEQLLPGRMGVLGYDTLTLRYLGKEDARFILEYDHINRPPFYWETKLLVTFCDVKYNDTILINGSLLDASMFGTELILKVYNESGCLIDETKIGTLYTCLDPLKIGQIYGPYRVLGFTKVKGLSYHFYSKYAIKVEDALDHILRSLNRDPRRGYGWWHQTWIWWCGYTYYRELWLDDVRLDPQFGAAVFCEERAAVQNLMLVVKNCLDPQGVKNITFNYTGNRKADVEVYTLSDWLNGNWWSWLDSFYDLMPDEKFTVDGSTLPGGKLTDSIMIRIYDANTGKLMDTQYVRTSGEWFYEVEPGNFYGDLEIMDSTILIGNGTEWNEWWGGECLWWDWFFGFWRWEQEEFRCGWIPEECFDEEAASEEQYRICSNITTLKQIINMLVVADDILARVAIYDAENTSVQNASNSDEYTYHLKWARRYHARGLSKKMKGQAYGAITDYKRSWKHSILAVKWAIKKPKSGDPKEEINDPCWCLDDDDCKMEFEGPWWMYWYIKFCNWDHTCKEISCPCDFTKDC